MYIHAHSTIYVLMPYIPVVPLPLLKAIVLILTCCDT